MPKLAVVGISVTLSTAAAAIAAARHRSPRNHHRPHTALNPQKPTSQRRTGTP
ncbi:hypothetical protein LQK93_04023 [Terrabacter sp. BE26]